MIILQGTAIVEPIPKGLGNCSELSANVIGRASSDAEVDILHVAVLRNRLAQQLGRALMIK